LHRFRARRAIRRFDGGLSLQGLGAVLTAIGFLDACGGHIAPLGGSPADSSDGSSTTTAPPPRAPTDHRDAGVRCPSDRGPGCPSLGYCGAIAGSCASDTECDAGVAGRCIVDLPSPLACSYDECSSDSDCPAHTPCQCRSDATSISANVCVRASDCAVDSDCGPNGYCSPSAACTVTYHCHTAADRCLDDRDCAALGATPYCLFDTGAGRWACAARPACPHSK
jgi:hypothetical protein